MDSYHRLMTWRRGCYPLHTKKPDNGTAVLAAVERWRRSWNGRAISHQQLRPYGIRRTKEVVVAATTTECWYCPNTVCSCGGSQQPIATEALECRDCPDGACTCGVSQTTTDPVPECWDCEGACSCQQATRVSSSTSTTSSSPMVPHT